MRMAEPLELDKIRKTAIIGLFSDDYMLQTLVLKGGNALNFAYNISSRSSVDIDVSMQKDFGLSLDEAGRRLESSLKTAFSDEGYELFDYEIAKKPSILSEDLQDFWGGYRIEFKLAPKELFETYRNELGNLRRRSTAIDDKQRRKFKIDFSNYEYCQAKKSLDMGGYIIYVYTPRALVCEKLRAVCQQMDAYREVVPMMKKRPRARDFFDIYCLLEEEETKFDLFDSESLDLLPLIFGAKRVDLALLGQIEGEREYHQQDFGAVEATVSPDVKLGDFDFYFEYVVNLANGLLERLDLS